MKKFTLLRYAQRFLSTNSSIHNHFQLRRHLISASEHRAARSRAFTSWREAAGLARVA